ncbi:hypothetical protein BO94DRAFT_532533 [Aspergillus sclerotioniger CBS 115572]|uniref:Uncharacterized protein n=1 Tax=Aspergillus sclerotioniger CBS 115572 TaxID=1450535 RepID=A0A317X7R4_9EURO|nr:hypothetical protein BO94DRAFT_532533 [Aspergillus sclerotioniger CBS 115572]PWY93597.1 hypothetical protein BO94DRAFT_532533 [Aspergillus sclerotioniger CBS 115572]
MNRDKGKRPENYNASAFFNPSTKKQADSSAISSHKRGGVQSDPSKVRWPFLG